MMAKNHGGRIINVGSIAGRVPLKNNSAYGAAKAGLALLTATIKTEHKSDNIRATILHLGAVRTELWRSLPGFDNVRRCLTTGSRESSDYIIELPLRMRVDELCVLPGEGIL